MMFLCPEKVDLHGNVISVASFFGVACGRPPQAHTLQAMLVVCLASWRDAVLGISTDASAGGFEAEEGPQKTAIFR